ncbi:MAG: RNA degradosome polyphosphate kinase [Propionibacteriaceae bacterium]|nr:RNA degradosome polyphosphate kinase [Propionibacteriaceae bacterium]
MNSASQVSAAVDDVEDIALPDDRYSDRELSWLSFNNRVLDLAKDSQRVPLLERVRFLAIVSSNLDEFFMVRVAGLKRRMDAGLALRGTSGLLPRELHDAILSSTRDLVDEQSRVFREEIRPGLADEGIALLSWDDLTSRERAHLDELFEERIFPVLTPLAVDPSHPFPYISGLSLNLAVQLRNPDTGARLFARVKVPNVLPRFIPLIDEGRYVLLEDVISAHLDSIFTGMDIVHAAAFRVTRNEDLEVEEDDAENILFALEKELLRRKVGRPPVRLEVAHNIDPDLLDTLAHELDVTMPEVFFVDGPLDLTGLTTIADIDREDLKYEAFLPRTNPQLAEVETSHPADLFAALKKRDVLLHHPYDSFATSVQRFIEQAAADPQVLAIKQTLYRTSGDSPIVDALIEAAQAGKQVLALVEIKARFDEQANIAWARKLEKAGVHVVYGLVGLKTHCKLSLVIRDEGDGLRRYCHIGTGNYNPKTARLYEDMGLLTSNPIITDDVARLFNHLSGMTAENHYRRLYVSPHGIRAGLLDMIDNEIRIQKAGGQGRVRIKVNSIVDEATMDALYRASQAGVKVDLWVRGICALRAGIPGLSENIRVRSILGRFLEHSRLFWFDNDGHPSVGLGSADLMHRNLDRRVEVIVQLANPEHIAHIDALFNEAFDEGTASWWLTPEGWEQRTTGPDGEALTDIQAHLIQMSRRRSVWGAGAVTDETGVHNFAELRATLERSEGRS